MKKNGTEAPPPCSSAAPRRLLALVMATSTPAATGHTGQQSAVSAKRLGAAKHLFHDR